MRRGEIQHGTHIVETSRAVFLWQQFLELHVRADEFAHCVLVFGAVQSAERNAALGALLFERGCME